MRTTKAQQRVLDLIATRPGLSMDYGSSLTNRVEFFDSNDPLWGAWTTESVLDSLARQGRFPAITDTEGSNDGTIPAGGVYADLDAFNEAQQAR